MRRREFVKGVLAAGGALACGPGISKGVMTPAEATEVKRVLLMFECHLDVGFTDTQAAVIRKYFDQYFPQAIQVAAAMRHSGADRYIWTTGSWLLYEYLDQAKGEHRKRAEEAAEVGDLAWQALPFNWQTEMLDRSMIEGALGICHSLDRRFGRMTVGAKMEDVPGHTRGLVAPLAGNGVKLLDIGVNGASTVPDIPPVFVWKEPDGASLMMMYHHGYGGIARIPGSDLAVGLEVRNDNGGPHSVDEVKTIFAGARKQFPNARVTAANLSEIALAMEPYRANLPVVTQEIGDTWIYGAASDPIKVARYRELIRLRKEWLEQGKFRVGDSTDLGFLRRLLLAAEHTWGVDTKRLKDYKHYTPKALAAALDEPLFRVAETSWAEKRRNNDEAVANLPRALRAEASGRIRALQPAEPDRTGLEPRQAASELDTAHFVVALDPKTGAISRLHAKAAGRDWASPERPLALFAYQTLSQQDYERYRAAYVVVKTWWSPLDFGKPDIEKFGAESRVWLPTLVGCWSGKGRDGFRILAQLRVDDAEAERAGLVAWPQKMYLDLLFPDAEPGVRLSFTCLGKIANRLPEAMWLSFFPLAPESNGWTIEKANQPVSPFDVVRGGNRHMHAVSSGVNYKDAYGSLRIETLDAPVVALGERSPISYSNDQPDLAQGIHISLFNNAWGTNYIQWFGEDTHFRFIVRV